MDPTAYRAVAHADFLERRRWLPAVSGKLLENLQVFVPKPKGLFRFD
jgi:hypothetical protein